jgi:hypothetical protein
MAESKVISIFCRTFVAARDIVDLFLFQDQLVGASPQRVRAKLLKLGTTPAAKLERLGRLIENRTTHVRTIDAIIERQIDPATAANLNAAGGGAIVFDSVVAILQGRLGLAGGSVP